MKTTKTIVSAAVAAPAATVAADENVEVTTTTAATAVAETATATTTKEATAEEKAKADVDAAQVVVDETQGDVEDAQADVDEAQKNVDDAQKAVDEAAVEKARLWASTSAKNVSDVKAAEAERTAELEAAAQAASVVTTVIHSNETAADHEKIRPADRTPITYTGEEVVTIQLTDAQAAEVANAPYDRYSYTPNNEAVTRHALALINEIRALNGIPGVVTPEAMASTIAELRAKEMLRKDVLSHVTTDPEVHRLGRIVTPDGIRYIGGENAAGLLNVGTYSKRGFGIMSDEELAYHLVLGWFTDYDNVYNASNTDITTESGCKLVYGHAINLLSAHGHIGVAVAVTEPSSEGHFEGFHDNYGYVSMNVTGTGEDSRAGYAQYNDFNVTLTNGVMELLYKGRPLKFIAKKTFNYVTTTTATDTAEQLALDAHRVARIREAEEAAMRAQNALTAARQVAADATTRLTTAKARLSVAAASHAAAVADRDAAASRLQALLDAQRAEEVRDTYTAIVNNGGQPVAVVDADGKVTYVAGAAGATGVTAAPTAKGDKTLPKTGEIASLTGLAGYAILSSLGLVATQRRRKQ